MKKSDSPGRPARARLTFDSTRALVDWMQDEYLSALLVRSMKPRPGVAAPRGAVTFEWGLDGVEAGKLFPFIVRAEGVRCWSLEGAWDKERQISFDPDVRGDSPVVLCQMVPGRLVLECERVVVERLPAKRYRSPPQPRDDALTVWGDRELSWSDLLGLIEPPVELELYEQGTDHIPHRRVTRAEQRVLVLRPLHRMYRLQDALETKVPWLFVCWSLTPAARGHHITVSRGTIDDEAWAKVRRLPGELGPCTVLSGNIRCSGAEWVERWCRAPS